MQKSNNTRLTILTILTILSAGLFVLTIIPNSPFIEQNYCMDTEKAKTMSASTDINAKNKFIEKRNNQCKDLLKGAQKPKDVYQQLDNCALLDSAVDASNQYIALKQGNSSAIKAQINDMEKVVDAFSYCPQYGDVVKALKNTKTSAGK